MSSEKLPLTKIFQQLWYSKYQTSHFWLEWLNLKKVYKNKVYTCAVKCIVFFLIIVAQTQNVN